MKKILIGSICLCFLLLSACSNDGANESANSDGESTSSSSQEMKKEESSDTANRGESYDSVSNGSTQNEDNITAQDDRMMIYKADIQVNTKDYDQYDADLRTLITEHDGYLVDSSTQKGKNDQTSATLKLRVPQGQFESFIAGLKPLNGDIRSVNRNGQDVTEDYVDLESRLSAKQKVEERLLTFLDQADNTENLLEVSKDLERVQEEIEVIQGKMNYLQNQSNFSTITLHIQETKVIVPEAEQEELQTWEKTKQTFVSSVQNMKKFFSFLIIGLVGYSPVLLVFIVAGALIWFGRRYLRSKREKE